MTDHERLVAKIKAQNVPPGEVVVSLEDFFVGNNDLGSIGCNLGAQHPGIAMFYETLRGIRSKPEVQDVLVRVCEFDDPVSWPYTDTVYILTLAQHAEVRQWVASLKADEVCAEWMYGLPPKAPALQPGIIPYSIWWD